MNPALPSRVRIGRILFVLVSWLFLLCVLAQVFIAGMAVFSDPGTWSVHVSFVRTFSLLPLVMFLLTFLAGLTGRARWISLGLFGLVVLQYLTAQAFSSVGGIAALHPIIALLIFWGAVETVKRRSLPVATPMNGEPDRPVKKRIVL